MRLYIPSIKDRFYLDGPWNFTLDFEHRNMSLISKLEGVSSRDYYLFCGEWRNKYPSIVSLPVGTELSVERIYIRSGKKMYDSITFKIESCPDKRLNKARFWAKLPDVNTMEIS